MAAPKPRVRLVRPEILTGATYKIKPPPLNGESIYITINNAEMDDQIRPVEIMVNSKHIHSFAWVSAMTRMLSAQLQQPGPFPEFIIEELIETMDPEGGYFTNDHLFFSKTRKSEWCPSVPAHIGLVLREHCVNMGLIERGKFQVKRD